MSDVAFVSTGDPGEDAKIAADFELHSARMDKNICPNGCGPMTWVTPHHRTCPECRFEGWSNVPFDMEGGNA
jgi:hypothetical protein